MFYALSYGYGPLISLSQGDRFDAIGLNTMQVTSIFLTWNSTVANTAIYFFRTDIEWRVLTASQMLPQILRLIVPQMVLLIL